MRRDHMLGAGDDTNRRRGGPQTGFDDECAGRAQGALLKESRGHFSRRVDRALDDPSLQKALVGAMTGLRGRRDKAFESFDFEKGRADLKQRRVANLDRLPELLEQFTQRLAAVGGVVHLAKDAAEAREIIGQRTRRIFRLGQRVRVLVDRIDPVERKIQFALLDEVKLSRTKRKKRLYI